ncbi:MAG: dodecin family protein [Limibacillus sp.]|jgi:flavin-binding protein dodecin
MADNVYSVSEVVGTSKTSIEDAINGAVTTAARKLKNLDWFEVKEIRGHLDDQKVAHYQVVVKIGFRYEDS